MDTWEWLLAAIVLLFVSWMLFSDSPVSHYNKYDNWSKTAMCVNTHYNTNITATEAKNLFNMLDMGDSLQYEINTCLNTEYYAK